MVARERSLQRLTAQVRKLSVRSFISSDSASNIPMSERICRQEDEVSAGRMGRFDCLTDTDPVSRIL